MLRFISLSILAALAAAVIAIGCGDDSPTDSPPVVNDYELVLNSTYNPDADSSRFLLVASTLHDSITDSVYVDYPYMAIAFSPDGETVYYSRLAWPPFPDHVTWATDWETGDTVALHVGAGGDGLIVDETNTYVFIHDGSYPTIFSLPDLQPVFIDSSHGSSGGVFIPGRPQAVYYTFAETHITFIDYSSTPPVSHQQPIEDTAGNPVNVQAIGTSPSGDSLLLIGSVNWERWYFLIAATDNLTVLAQIVLPPYVMYDCTPILMRSYHKRAFFYYPGSLWDFGGSRLSRIDVARAPGILYQVDLSDRQVSVLLDESDFGFPYIEDMVLTPDGRYLYVSSVIWIAKIDMVTGEKRQLFDNRHLSCGFMAINPKPRPQ